MLIRKFSEVARNQYTKNHSYCSRTLLTTVIKAFKVPRNKSNKWCVRFLWSKQQNNIEVGKETKDLLYSWKGRYNILAITIFPKFTYKFNTIFIKIPVGFFKELEKTVQKCCKGKRGGVGFRRKRRKSVWGRQGV